MSLDYAVDKFPVKVDLNDGLTCQMRMLGKEDEEAFQEFYLSVPEHERLFVKRPVQDPALFRDWCSDIDLEKNLSLLLIRDGRIIGEATLHQRQGGWKRHIGVVTVLTHLDFRGRGIVPVLVEEQINIARHLGLKKLEVELNGERTTAMKELAMFGFSELFRLHDYLEDMQKNTHDYIVMGLTLITNEEYAGMG